MTTAPFTSAQVRNIQEFQASGMVHELTCGNNHSDDRVLRVNREGLYCPTCKYTQKEVMDDIASGSFLMAVKMAYDHMMPGVRRER